jgi:hypothetical protein
MKKILVHFRPDFQHIPPEGYKIEAMETSSGVKGLGSIEFNRNRFDPFLTVYETHLDLNVTHIKQRFYDQIERIILLPRKKPYAMRLYFAQDLYTFSATILDRELLQQLYDFILQKRNKNKQV